MLRIRANQNERIVNTFETKPELSQITGIPQQALFTLEETAEIFNDGCLHEKICYSQKYSRG